MVLHEDFPVIYLLWFKFFQGLYEGASCVISTQLLPHYANLHYRIGKNPATIFPLIQVLSKYLFFLKKPSPGVVDFFPNLHPVDQILLSDIHTVQPNIGEFQWIAQKDEPCEGLTVLQLCWEFIDLVLTCVRIGRHASSSFTVQF